MDDQPTYRDLKHRLEALEKAMFQQTPDPPDGPKEQEAVEFLAESAMKFIELSFGENLYQFIAKRIKDFVGDGIIAVNTFDPDANRLLTHTVLGLGKQMSAVAELMGGHPVGRAFMIDQEAMQNLKSGRLVNIPEGLYRLSPSIPKAVFASIEKLLNVGDVYSMGFSWDERLFGNMVILLPKGKSLYHKRVIEAFVRLSSVALQRKQAEDALKKAYGEIESRVKQRTEALTRETEEHRKTAEALRENESKYRLLAETAGEIIITLNLQGKITYINRRGIEISGYSSEEALGTDITQVLPKEKAAASKELLALRAAGNKELFVYETEIIGKDEKEIPLEISSTLITKKGVPCEVLLTARDITARKNAEAALRKSEREYRALIDTMNEGLVGVDEKWHITFVNNRFIEMVGYTQEELVGRSFHELASDHYKATTRKEHDNRRQGKPGRYELELVRSDGKKLFVLCSPQPTYDSNGRYNGGFGVISDITELKASAEKLRNNEERFKFLAENMADIVWTLDMDFNATYVSPSVEKVLGFTPEERKRQTLDEMVTPDSLERITAMFLAEIQRDEVRDADPERSVTIEVEYYHKNGTTLWMENSVKAVRNQDGEIVGMYGASRDITDRKKAQEALVQEKEKLQDALSKIKKLSGLLPICASCKKIRDDRGYWNQIESYILKHSEAEFSHSICPDCAKRLYPDLDIQ